MSNYNAGVHTFEVRTDTMIHLDNLPGEYRKAVDPQGNNRYRVNLPRLPFMREYNGMEDSEAAIMDAVQAIANAGGQAATVTRIDFRLDNYEQTYEGNLPIMRLLVYTLAHKYGLWSRIWDCTQRQGGTPLSVRAMPDENNRTAKRGIEYYNKLVQAETDQHGNARLEFRRLNMNGERLSFVLQQWRHELENITKVDYLATLEAHAEDLRQYQTAGAPIKKAKPYLIAYEQQAILDRFAGGKGQARKAYDYLPRWNDLKQHIEQVKEILTF